MFRVYEFGPDGHITKPPTTLHCESKAQAIAEARRLLDGLPVEVWQGAELIARLDVPEPVSRPAKQ